MAAWMLQALRNDFRIDLLTWRPVDLDAVNRYGGTELESSDLRLLTLQPATRVLDCAPVSFALLKSALLLRHASRIAPRYDALVTANNEADFGQPAVQYVHYPWNRRPRPAVDLRWYHRPAPLRAYYRLADRVSPFDPRRVARNLTLVNSEWTAALVRDLYPGIVTRTVYPPVAGAFPLVDWPQREDGVVILGRIAPEKRIDVAIDIVGRLRERGWPLRLHVVGSKDNSSKDKAVTYRTVKTLARRHQEWVQVHEDLSRAELCALLSRQRYGIHAMPEEHFGIAVAEMVCAGMIPFVPDGGGQREIVSDVPELLWRAPEEAVERMAAIVGDPERQREVLRCLAPRREGLGVEVFMREVRAALAEHVARRTSTRTGDRRSRSASPGIRGSSTPGEWECR